MAPHSASQRYLSTRGGSYDLSFEEVVLKGLAADGGLFIPEEIPSLPEDWATKWPSLTFEELAFEIFSLYIAAEEIPPNDLRDIIRRSYSTFRAPDITPLVTLDSDSRLHLLELFHGPTFAFKDVALQFLGNLFEYFLVRKNQGKDDDQKQRAHLTVVGATSGDTGSAAIYGLRGKKDVSVFIMHPKGKVSPIQEAQMTTVTDANVHNIAVEGTFDDCQDIVKALFADKETNEAHRLAAVNSINWARILAQITYYFQAYFLLSKQQQQQNSNSNSNSNSSSLPIRFVVPTGNFGDILAGYFATRMGLPTDRLVVATNENDILHRFWQTGHYEKHPVHGREAEGGIVEDGAKAHAEGVKETLAPAMDILVSSNFERLLWFLAFQTSDVPETNRRRMSAGEKVKGWLEQLKREGGFGVGKEILEKARETFASERVSDTQTLETIKLVYDQTLPEQGQPQNGSVSKPASASTNGSGSVATTGTVHNGHYILDPHSAIGVAAARRSIKSSSASESADSQSLHHIALSTAHPAKFSHAVELALKDVSGFSFNTVLPEQFVGLEDLPRRVTPAPADWRKVREVIDREVEEEKAGKRERL